MASRQLRGVPVGGRVPGCGAASLTGLAAASDSGEHDLFLHDLDLGHQFVVGADEAGRGCLAGPIVAASVCFDRATLEDRGSGALDRLFDSKRLTEKRREALYPAILESARSVRVALRSARYIDAEGIQKANIGALTAAILPTVGLDDAVRLVDGFSLGTTAPRHSKLVKGDSLSATVAAASIVAKVTRDALMRSAAEIHPGYGFEGHKGYGSAAHREAIAELGPCPIHRLSFRLTASPDDAPVADDSGTRQA